MPTNGLYVCRDCGDANIEVAKWVDPNTLKVNMSLDIYHAIIDEKTGSTLAHCTDCDDYVTLIWVEGDSGRA